MVHANAFLRTALGALFLLVLAAALLLRPGAAVSMMAEGEAHAAVSIQGAHACCPGAPEMLPGMLQQHSAAPGSGSFHHFCCELTLAAGEAPEAASAPAPQAPFPAARLPAPKLLAAGIYRPPIA